MTATDELRALLEERGVEYDTLDGMTKNTIWCVGEFMYYYSEDILGATELTVAKIYGLTSEQAIAATLGSGTCEFTIEYDRDEAERRRKMYEENPLDLFPQDMPESAWTCSNCGQQFKCHYDRQTGKLLPVPDWMKCCPSCGKRIRKAVDA